MSGMLFPYDQRQLDCQFTNNDRWTCLDFPTNTIIGSQLLFPAISVPAGTTKDLEEDPEEPELPVGLEILGLPLREESLMAVAAGVEAAFRGR